MIRFDYDAGFIADLKDVVPPWARGWNPDRRGWLVDNVWLDGVRQLADDVELDEVPLRNETDDTPWVNGSLCPYCGGEWQTMATDDPVRAWLSEENRDSDGWRKCEGCTAVMLSVTSEDAATGGGVVADAKKRQRG